jgi:quinol monooxygenase YgiN
MANYIRATAEHSISKGKMDEFKKLVAEIIDRVEATEPNTISYEWFLSNDESKCYVVQIYKDSEAGMAHLRNIADLMSPFHEVAPLTGLMVFGSPSDQLIQALAPVGARFYAHFNGVTRWEFSNSS